jgi:hypothetical protein
MSTPIPGIQALDRKPVLITTADGTPIVSGTLKVSEPGEAPTTPAVRLEFVLRNVTFMIQVPDAELPRLALSLKGGHYTYALPGGSQFLLQPMGEPGSPDEPERKPPPKIRTE